MTIEKIEARISDTRSKLNKIGDEIEKLRGQQAKLLHLRDTLSDELSKALRAELKDKAS